MLNEGNQIHNFISSSSSGTVINYGSGSDFLTSYGSGSIIMIKTRLNWKNYLTNCILNFVQGPVWLQNDLHCKKEKRKEEHKV